MKTTVEYELESFPIPSYVNTRGTQGFVRVQIPLSALSQDDLELLCREFREGVLIKAGKKKAKGGRELKIASPRRRPGGA
mgnify:CR=1 FL=1